LKERIILSLATLEDVEFIVEKKAALPYGPSKILFHRKLDIVSFPNIEGTGIV